MSQFDQIIFKNKSFGNVLEEIYENQKKKDKQVSALINELKPMIEEIGDATLIVPLIKEYMEIGVKNDEMLVKMAALAQRAMNSASGENSLGISDEEKEQLLSEISKLKSE
jgi:2',3'-cyclic-nucleotide 2'-phosphodiesterase (5'-nucleotidase family)